MVLAFFCSVPDLIVSHFNYILSYYYALTALAVAIAAGSAVNGTLASIGGGDRDFNDLVVNFNVKSVG